MLCPRGFIPILIHGWRYQYRYRYKFEYAFQYGYMSESSNWYDNFLPKQVVYPNNNPILVKIQGYLSLTNTITCLKNITNTDTGMKNYTNSTTAYQYWYWNWYWYVHQYQFNARGKGMMGKIWKNINIQSNQLRFY